MDDNGAPGGIRAVGICCRGDRAPGGGFMPPPGNEALYCFVNTIVDEPEFAVKTSVNVLLSELRL
jgi:hypothetical protein